MYPIRPIIHVKAVAKHDERILRASRDLTPLNRSHLLGTLHHDAIKGEHEEQARQRGCDLRH
jgi:hypothetical protein